jgi:tetratricopeptide (TPR) repeat protein
MSTATPSFRAALSALASAASLAVFAPAAWGQGPAAEAPAVHSRMDAPLFYQVLKGELELKRGEPGNAYELILDAARRTRDESLFKRAMEIAVQSRALEQAYAATRVWRAAVPQSLDALRYQVQLLMATGRGAEVGEPLRELLALTPAAERPGLIGALPRILQRSGDAAQAASLIADVVKPYADAPDTRVPAKLALARAWLQAGDNPRALALAREAQALDATAPGPALLAMEMQPAVPEAESLVRQYMRQAGVPGPVRMAYVRSLMAAQRYPDAIAQLEIATRERPNEAGPYLTLGALHLDLRHPREAEAALGRYVELASAEQAAAAGSRPPATGEKDDDEDDDASERPDRGLQQAYLALAQAAELRGDFKAAEGWLAKVDDPQRALDVQTRRATLLARQGQVAQARELIRQVPERQPEDARAKLMAEAGVLREAKRWKDAFDVLAAANKRFADDADLIYEQAMVAEKMNRLDEMERLLKRVMALKPESPHAHNALGYSLADRGLRLPEARQLIQKALELAPGDPFITDSLGWVEYRLGRAAEAIRLLRQAYAARPDAEIGAHLGEVLWTSGEREEARRIWREALARDAGNEVLRETLTRLRAEP